MTQAEEKGVRRALARLVSRGIDSIWLPEAEALLELPAVRRRVEELGPDSEAEALRETLSAAVASLGQSQYRRLLTIVLGLEPEYAEMTAGAKRELAGREFRGGNNPVSANTIRKHHEPNALDELAAVLCGMPSSASGAAREAGDERMLSGFEWHPVLHNLWSRERLIFWRLSFGSYDPERGVARVGEVMKKAGIVSWAAFEVFGPFDLLIRAWLPVTMSLADLEAVVLDELGDAQVHLDFFAVDEVIRHWPWVSRDRTMAEPSRDRLTPGIPSRDIESIDAGTDPERFREYRDQHLVVPVPEEVGIGFIVAVAPTGPAVVPALTQQTAVGRTIADLLARLDRAGFSQLSLYAGSGFARYLIQGRIRAESFHELEHSLVRPLQEILSADGGRTYTFVLSSAPPLIREERMLVDAAISVEQGAEGLLRDGEGAALEIVGGAFEDGPGRSAHTAQLARAVVGFLNANGGTVLIGAAEKERLRNGDPRIAELFEGAPEVGEWAVRGIDAEASEGVDWFQRRLWGSLEKQIEPDPLSFVQTRFDRIGNRTVCIVEVQDIARSNAGPWFYCREGRGKMQFVVRRGPASVVLLGPEADAYKVQQAGGKIPSPTS